MQLEEVYEEEPVIPRIAKSVREVPRDAKPVREVITSSDEEILEYHDIIEFQERPQMTIFHKRKHAWARDLIQDGEKNGVP
jgi:U3 small nucleolar RNA-associated protein 14